MSANKTRVQVRGTVGKSVRFPTSTGGSGATIGVNFALPDGSIPTLQQLAAALATGAALQDQPGNIIPPGGGPTVIWQNIQYVPAPVLNPPRYVHEEEAGEEYHRMAVPGPIGPRGVQGFSGVFADDPEDPMPGPPGAAGAAGANGSAGPPGAISAVHLWPDDPEDQIQIPGAAGPPGNNGSAGPPGVISAVHLWPDDAEDPGLIPGAPGPAGANGSQGAPGVISAVHLWPDDPEDMIHMPGVQGNVGTPGPAGVISAVHLWPDDPEDPGLLPGPQGPQGPAGTASQNSNGVGWAAYLDQDAPEDHLEALRALPNNPRFKQVTIDASGTTSADIVFAINNKAVTIPYMSVAGDGSGFIAPGATTGLYWDVNGKITIQTPSSGGTLALNSIAGQNFLTDTDGAITYAEGTTAATEVYLAVTSAHGLSLYTSNVKRLSIAAGGAVTISSTMAINGGTPTAKLAGFGTPVSTITAGQSSASTLAVTAGNLGALLLYLKTIGFVGA